MAVQTITYSDKSYINENASVAATNKVQATDMNEIKTVVNNNASELTTGLTEISNIINYTNSEISVGKWVDNKTIYRSVVDLGSFPNATYKEIDTNISNIDTVVSLRGIGWGATGNAFPLPYVGQTSSGNMELVYLKASNKLRITTSENRNTMTGVAIIEYTKTS